MNVDPTTSASPNHWAFGHATRHARDAALKSWYANSPAEYLPSTTGWADLVNATAPTSAANATTTAEWAPRERLC